MDNMDGWMVWYMNGRVIGRINVMADGNLDGIMTGWSIVG